MTKKEMWSSVITVIDIGIGNISSVGIALKSLGISHRVITRSEEIEGASRVIFPGVGSFSEAMQRLSQNGFIPMLRKKVQDEKIPILGICLGMQLFAAAGEEGGATQGLNFIRGAVRYHRAAEKGLRVPHIGWNDVKPSALKIFQGLPECPCFYFVHSYEFIPDEPVLSAYTNYGVDFVSAIQKEHIVGVQFHPEKSQSAGLHVLRNFCQGVY